VCVLINIILRCGSGGDCSGCFDSWIELLGMARSRWVGTMVALLQRCKQAKNECANAAISSPARCTDAVLRREILSIRKELPQNNNNNLNGEIFFFEETQKIGSYFGPFRDAHLRLVPLSCVVHFLNWEKV
jgi:hypothetical protein